MLRLPSLGELDRGLRDRVFPCTSPMDMRKESDTLAALVRDALGHDPLSGQPFLFVGRRRDRLKILYSDRDGFALWYKRLERGTFRMPASWPEAGSVELRASKRAILLEGIDLRSLRRRRRFTRPG